MLAPPMLLAGGLLVVLVLDAWWLARFRRGYPLDIDESGYMTIAFDYAAAWRLHGPSGLWQAFVNQRSQAPLVPLLTVPIALVRQGILDSFGVLLGFVAALGLAAYGIASRLSGRWYGVAAALATLTAPGVIDFSRQYIFALPAAAMLTLSVWALLRSDGLQRTGWAIAFGGLLGACVLTRTMMLALVPGPLLAAALQAGGRPGKRRAAVNLSLALVAGCGLAAIWLAGSWSAVTDYLTSAGYGSQAAQYGSAPSVTRLLVIVYLYLPLSAVLAASLLVGGAASIRSAGRLAGDRRPLRSALGSGELVLAVVVAEGWAALASTRNPGFGFELPMVAPLIILAVCAIARVKPTRVRQSLIFLLLAISCINLLSKADVWAALSDPEPAEVPALGRVPVIDGESLLAGVFRADGYVVGSPTHWWPSVLRGWETADHQAADTLLTIARRHGREPIVFMGSRNPLFNANTIELAARLYFAAAIPFGQLDPTVSGDSVAAYEHQLNTPALGQPNLLVLSQTSPGEYKPIVTQAKAARAATLLGFRRVRTVSLPDGRTASVWWLGRGPVLAP